MSQFALPNLPEPIKPPARLPTLPAVARLYRPIRNQLEWLERDLDSLVAPDHPARAIWQLLDRLELAAFYADIKAVLDRPGHPATDPQVLLALWVYATVEGVGPARELDRLCHEHDVYRWLRGGVPINYHMLSDFRVAHQEDLDELLTQIVACLVASGVVTLQKVAQDGMKVRASAGAASFRRKERLEQCLEEAKAQVERLKQEREHPDPGVSKRQRAARERAARERVQRVQQALEHLPVVQAVKERQQRRAAKAKRAKVKEPRASTTDPQARVMKMADGGFRPADNLELATDVGSGVIVGVAVVNQEDGGQASVLEEQVARRAGKHPDAYLVDGNFATRPEITTLTQRGLTVYAPVRAPRNQKDPEARYRPHWGDTEQVVVWRARMGTEEAQAIYQERGATAEWANAQVRQHGVSQLTVRGLAKATSVMLLVVIAHDLLRWVALLA